MTRTEKAILLDKILLKFEGNKTWTWVDMCRPEFYKDLNDDYYEVENHLKFLIGADMLKRNRLSPSMTIDSLSLTDKGFAVMTDLKNFGYVQKEQERHRVDEREEQTLFYAKKGFWVAIISVLIALIALFKCDGIKIVIGL